MNDRDDTPDDCTADQNTADKTAADQSTAHQSAADQRVAEFVELYSRYYPRLQFYVMALLPSAGDASEVMQEASLVLWKKFETFETGTNFFAWACKIARLQVMKYRERKGRFARLLDDEVLEKLCEEASQGEYAVEASLDALALCLDKLTERNRSLIRRRYQPHVTVQQLAGEIGCTANALSKLLGKIRRTLHECIERQLARELVKDPRTDAGNQSAPHLT